MGSGFCKDCCEPKDEGNLLIKAGNKLEKGKKYFNKFYLIYSWR